MERRRGRTSSQSERAGLYGRRGAGGGGNSAAGWRGRSKRWVLKNLPKTFLLQPHRTPKRARVPPGLQRYGKSFVSRRKKTPEAASRRLFSWAGARFLRHPEGFWGSWSCHGGSARGLRGASAGFAGGMGVVRAPCQAICRPNR